MESWGYAWLLILTVTGRESCDSLRLSSAASCSSPPLRASLRDRANSSAAQETTTSHKIQLFYCGVVQPPPPHSPSFKADVGSPLDVIITPGKIVTTLNSTYLLTNNRTDLSQLDQLPLTSDVEAI